MVIKFLRVALLAALTLGLIWAPGAAADEPDDLAGLYQRAQAAMQVEDFDTAYLTAQIILSHAGFDALPSYVRADLFGLAGAAAFFVDDDRLQEAIGYLDEADRLGATNPVVFMVRSMARMAADDIAGSAADIMKADRLERGMINLMRTSEVAPILTMLSLSDDQASQSIYPRFVDFMVKRWRSEHPFDDAQLIHFHAARIAAKEGDLVAAARHIETLDRPSLRLRVQVEREFEPFWIEDAARARAHIRSGAVLVVERFQTLAEDHPGFIEPVLYKAQALALLGETERVRLLLETTRAQVLDGVLINDVSEQMAWLLNDMASNAYRRGDLESAVALMSEAAGLSEFSAPNVTQRANLAMLLALAGQEQRALAELQEIDLDMTSDYGEGVMLTTRICANHYLGETGGIEADLERFDQLGRITSGLKQFAFACLGDLDRGAALLVTRLNDPTERADALAEVQIYLDIDTEYEGPHEADLRAYDDALLARGEVLAAIDRAGRRLEVGIAY
jgi:tetratricopeptide (TPR) repeat protein